VPSQQPFDVKDYAGMSSMIGGYNVTPETIAQAKSMMGAFHGIGGSVLNWTVSWPRIHANIKIAGRDETVTNWLKKRREGVADKPASEWPRVDSSHYDPRMEIANPNGINRAATYLPLSLPDKPFAPEQEWML